MPITNKNFHKKGFSLIEVLVACAIISTSTFALMSASAKGNQLSVKAVRQTQGSFILEEGAEAVKSIRDANWTNISGLTVGTTYYLSFNTGTNTWSLDPTPVSAIDSTFTRTVVFSAVGRDANDDIVESGGTTDARTKKVTVNVSWMTSGGDTSSKDLVFYISDIFT